MQSNYHNWTSTTNVLCGHTIFTAHSCKIIVYFDAKQSPIIDIIIDLLVQQHFINPLPLQNNNENPNKMHHHIVLFVYYRNFSTTIYRSNKPFCHTKTARLVSNSCVQSLLRQAKNWIYRGWTTETDYWWNHAHKKKVHNYFELYDFCWSDFTCDHSHCFIYH